MRDCSLSPSRAIVFGREPHDFVKVRTLGAAVEEWVPCRIAIGQNGLAGSFDISLWTREFDRLQSELSKLHHELVGWLQFRPAERRITFTVQGDGSGNYLMRGETIFDPELGPWVRFELSFDRNELAVILGELRALRESLE
jgi:hypothetical protein